MTTPIEPSEGEVGKKVLDPNETEVEEAIRWLADELMPQASAYRAKVIADLIKRQQQEIERLRGALREVRAKAIPAGGAIVRKNPDWQEKVTEVLDTIDNALASGAAQESEEER